MKHNVKRLLSAFIALALMFTVLPTNAFAASVEVIETDAKENLNQADGIVLTKKAEALSDGTANITITAYTTGEVKQTTTTAKPTDIVLVLDVSGSMKTEDSVRVSYDAALGNSYTYRSGSNRLTGYGFNDSNTYCINTGTEEEPTYTEVTKIGRDSNNYDCFSYTVNGANTYIYPVLASGIAANRVNTYAVVQFYLKNETTTSRMETLTDAVYSFIDTTLSMNQGTDTANMHRISIVKFAGKKYSNNTTDTPVTTEGNGTYTDSGNTFNYSQVVKGLTPVDAGGAEALKSAVGALTPAGSTAVDKGLALADAVLDEQPDSDRDEIVIVFTDGEPNYFSGFDETVANAAIQEANTMKNNDGITIYGVSVAPNADAEDMSENINKFMHYVSSNAPDAESMSSATSLCDMSAGYYMTPRADVTLEMIFDEILKNIDSPTITLGTKAVMIDTISQYFDFASGDVSDVTLKTSARNADGTWAGPVSDANLSCTIVGDKITVDGFDFDANFISEKGRGDDEDFYGKRLEVSFNIVPDYDAIDADAVILETGAVPTNSGNAAIVNSDSSVAAEVEPPVLHAYKVTYKVDGEEISAFRRFAGTNIIVREKPEKAGWQFNGWTYPNNISVFSGEFIMPNEDVVITGEFTRNTYDVTYEIDGETFTDTYYKDEELKLPTKTPTKEDSVFEGWYVDEELTIPAVEGTPVTEDITLYPKFNPATTPIIPGDTVNYIVEHYKADADGNYPATATDSEFLGGKIRATVSGTPKNYDGYCYNEQISSASATLVKITTPADIVILKLYYDIDANTDAVPDKYQKKVIFKIVNGTWSDGTTDDITVILDLTTDGKWDINGSADYTASTGMIANAGYKNGAWDVTPPVTFSGTHTETFTYDFDRSTTPIIPGDTVNYIVEHYKADADGNYPATATDSEFLGGKIGATVSGTPKNYDGYCYNAQVSNNSATLVKITTPADIVILKLYYDIDTNADAVPDKYQKKVIYKIVNGTWSDGTTDDITVILDLKTDGKWDINGSADYTASTGMIANAGYKNGAWDATPPVTFSGTHTETFTYDFDRSTTPIIPGDTVNYIVEHYKADADGNYPATATDSEFLGGKIGATVSGTPKNYDGYCYNEQISSASATLVKITTPADIVILKLYYDIDANADAVPDKYQKKVIYKIVNGTWSDGTTDDITVILDLKTDGKWDINGSADYTAPVGMIANAGYKNGAWDVTPPTTFSGTHTETFIYDFDRSTTPIIPGDTVNYIVEHYKADADGNYPATATDSEFLGGKIGATVSGTPKNYDGYCYNEQISSASATLVKITTPADIVILKLYYDIDANTDAVPDKYQKKVIFKIVNGTWSDGTTDDITVILDLKTDGKWDINGSADYTAPVGMIAKPGYFSTGAWEKTLPETFTGTHTETFTYSFARIPSAGGVPSGSSRPTESEKEEDKDEQPIVVPGTVVLTKVDSSNKDKVISNVVFELYDSNDNLLGKYATNEEGKITVDELTPGDYYFKEVQPAGGYILNDTPNEFTIVEEKITEIVVEGTRNQVPTVFTHDHFAYIVGYPDGNVRPGASITRAEVATIFFRLLKDDVRNKYLADKNSFADVSQGMWFNTAISTMEAMGVITGYPDGSFRPNQPITRAEFAAIAQRFDRKNIHADVFFSDIADHWAKQYISNAGYNGWVTGYPDSTFHPDSYITRAETMTMINRVLQRLPGSNTDLHEDMIHWPDNQDQNTWFYIPVQEATNGHDYEGENKWTDLRDNPDWTIYEK